MARVQSRNSFSFFAELRKEEEERVVHQSSEYNFDFKRGCPIKNTFKHNLMSSSPSSPQKVSEETESESYEWSKLDSDEKKYDEDIIA